MARHGIPDEIVSDNGPQFSSQEFKKLKDLYEFDNVTSSPTYPQSNGKAIKTLQRIMLKEAAQRLAVIPTWDSLTFATPPQKD